MSSGKYLELNVISIYYWYETESNHNRNTHLFLADTERPEHNALDEFGNQQQDTAGCVYHHLHNERQNNKSSFDKELTSKFK